MNRFQSIVVAVVASMSAALLGLQAESRAQEKVVPSEGTKALKVVFHINFAGTEEQKGGLGNMANILKAVDKATIEVVCHGPGIGLVVQGQSKHADAVAKMSKLGVRFVACENTLREKSISKDQLLPNVGTVPSGAVEVVRKQQEGYGYFKP